MTAVLTLGGGFLLAVLWMDLMFDVQVLRYGRGLTPELPEDVLRSIAGYYRRVTTDARPMGYAVGVVMSITVLALLVEIAQATPSRGFALASLPLCAVPSALAMVRVFPNAVRLGLRKDPATEQSALARAICRDHLVCLGCIVGFLVLQLCGAGCGHT